MDSKFNDVYDTIMEGTGYPALDKMIKKLSDVALWDEAKLELEEDFKSEYDKSDEEWSKDAIKKILDKRHKINKNDLKLLENLLNSYAYVLETRGI